MTRLHRRLLRVALALAVGGLLAWWLHRHAGWDAPSPRIPVRRWPGARGIPGAEWVTFARPRALWLLVLAPYFATVVPESLADLPRVQRWLGVLARTLFATLLVLAFAGPETSERSAHTAAVFAVDVSDSIPDEALRDAHAWVERAVAGRDPADVRLLTFARRPRVMEVTRNGAGTLVVPPFTRHDTADTGSANALPSAREGSATDVQSALSLAYGLLPPGRVKRVVLLSDGLQTEGDALGESARATRFGTRVHVVPQRRGSPAEIAVRDLRVPDHVRVHEPFEVRATVFATRAAHVNLSLAQGEAPNGLDPTRSVDLQPGENDVRFRSVVRAPGDVTYALALDPAGSPDRFPANNRAVTTVSVPGLPAVLYVEGEPARAQYLRDALAGGEFDVELRGPREFPTSVTELERFDFVVLSDTAAESVSLGAQQALTRYVRDLGGGFLMAGGVRGFGLGGWQGTEIERLLPVRMDGERRRDEPAIALCLVIDRSGSMQGLPLELAKEAARQTAAALAPDDYLEVIGFDSEPERIVRMQAAGNRVRISNDIARLRSNGGTAIFPALDAAYQDLQVTRASVRHAILLTDGQSPVEGIRELVRSMVADGITVSTVGLGTQVDRTLLENIGRTWGGGRAYFTADPHALPQLFLRETQTVARNAVVEEPVQPAVVTPAGFLRGFPQDGLPLLTGYVSTRMKPAPAQLVLETANEHPEPLLARWHAGLGWALAWTSDVKNRWGVEWIRWGRFREFWTQLVREHMRQHRRNELDLRASLEGGRLHVAVDAITGEDRFDNGLDGTLVIRGPLPATTETTVPLRTVGPGRYEADIPLERYGAFALHATHRRDGRLVAESFGRVSQAYPREYSAREPDLPLLGGLATATGGRVDPTPEQVFDAAGETVAARRGLSREPLLAAVVLLLVDLLLRRVRLFDRDFRAVARQATR